MKSTTIAVDLAKTVFEVAVSEQPGEISSRRQLRRKAFASYFAGRTPCRVVMEACGTSHYWGRQLEALGYEVILLPPHAVRPYVLRDKTDRADAKGILEAYRNAEIRPVPVKTETQQALTAQHRVRSAWMKTRTSRLNLLRGVLREFGIVIPVGSGQVVPRVQSLLAEQELALTAGLRAQLAGLCEEITALESRIQSAEKELRRVADQDQAVQRLLSVPGIGLLTATALVAFIGDIMRFPSGRHLASFLGLTPREFSSGGRRRLGRISKRGDRYLRMLLVHGARSALLHAKRMKEPDGLRAWALEVEKREGHNKATVALANKLARVAWAVWSREETFESRPVEKAA